MITPKEFESSGSIAHHEVSSHLEIEQGNAAVLLDIGDLDGERGQSNLKLTKDGHTVLVPQPSDDPNDPLNWPESKKNLVLLTIGLAAFLADFQAAVGVPALVPQGIEWNMTPTQVNYAGNLNILMVGIGGVFWIPFIYFWGRAPVLFWITFTGMLFTLGTALVETFEGYYGLRALQGFTLAGGQSIGLAFIQDIFFFHQQARKIGIWTTLFLTCPYVGPMFGYYIVAKTDNWRIAFWMTFALSWIVLITIVLFADETWYRRDIPREQQPPRGNRILRLLGIWQIRVRRGYFMTVWDSYKRMVLLFFKPVIVPLLLYYLMTFMWVVGINATSSIIFSLPEDQGGYGFGPLTIGYLYFTPIIAVLIGEVIGNWGNDWLLRQYVRRNHGIFKPEVRLYPVYLSTVFMVPGLVLVGQALQRHLHWIALAFGWGMYIVAIMIASVAITAYALDSYPTASGEVSSLINLARIIGGFTIGYFQLDWGLKSGFDVSFGIQGAIVGAAILIIIGLHIWGEKIRAKGGAIKI